MTCKRTELSLRAVLINVYSKSSSNLNVLNDIIDSINEIFNKEIDNLNALNNNIDNFTTNIITELDDVERTKLSRIINDIF